MSFATRPIEWVSHVGHLGALVTAQCPWCHRWLRPCNMSRHIAANHHAQMTIYDLLDE